MSKAVLGSVEIDTMLNFDWNGSPSDNTRVVRETFETINNESVTIKTIHKKRFSFGLQLITTADRNTLNTLFNSEYFAFTPNPYDTTTYYVKVIELGNWLARPETNTLWDLENVTLEVIDLESSFYDLTVVRDNSFLYNNLGIGELNGAETILTVYFNASTGQSYSSGGRGTSSLPFQYLSDLQDQMTTHNIRFMKYEIAFSGIDEIPGYSRNYFYADGFSTLPVIKDFTSLVSGTITAMCLYERNKDDVFQLGDERKDWYKKADTSWFQEVGEFPERVLIVCADSLYIIDLDAQSVWMEFERFVNQVSFVGYSTNTVSTAVSVYAKNGYIFIATTDGGTTYGRLSYIDFNSDNGGSILTSSKKYFETISERTSAVTETSDNTIGGIVNRHVNSIHANVVNGTLYAVVGTDGGLSQINMETGVVYDIVSTATNKAINKTYLTKKGNICFTAQDNNSETNYYNLLISFGLLTTDSTGSTYGNYPSVLTKYLMGSSSPSNIPIDNFAFTSTADTFDMILDENSSLSESGQNKIILAKETKLTILHENSTPSNGWYQYITKDYNTGLLYGDTDAVGCYLNGTDSVIADRTYRGNTLTNNGTVAISSDSTAPYGVSASFDGSTQYLSTTDTDFNAQVYKMVGGWFYFDSVTSGTILSKDDGTPANSAFKISVSSGTLTASFYNSTSTYSTTGTVAVNKWYHIMVVYKPSTHVKLYINGINVGTNTTSIPATINASTVQWNIGATNGTASFDGKACQVKELNNEPSSESSFIKNEYEIGRNTIGQTATLQGNSNQVNSVSTLGDKILLSSGDVSNTGKVQSFNGNGSISLKDYADTVSTDNLVVANENDAFFSKNTDSSTFKLEGYIVGKDVFSELYKTISSAGSSAGNSTFSSGGSTQSVTDNRANPNSKIFVMPTEAQDGFWYVSAISDGSFTVSSTASEGADVDFDYLIINE